MENIIRSDITTELLEILELYCELILARIGLLEAKDCDPGLEEAIKSIIYAAPRTDVKELQQARQLLVEKYGKDFALEAIENRDGKVAERVLKKLKVEPPSQDLVSSYLKEIARTYGVAWPKGEQAPNEIDSDDEEGPGGGQAVESLEEPLTTQELNKATPPRDFGIRSPVRVAPPSPSIDNVSPRIRLPKPPELKPSAKMVGRQNKTTGLTKGTADNEASNSSERNDLSNKKQVVEGKIPDVDELAKRFAALKK